MFDENFVIHSAEFNSKMEAHIFDLEQNFIYGMTPKMFQTFKVKELANDSRQDDIYEQDYTQTLSLREIKDRLKDLSQEEIESTLESIEKSKKVF